MKCLLIVAALLGLASAASLVKRQAQTPGIWSALDQLRGKSRLDIEDISALLQSAKAGEDYPNLSEIPEKSSIDCASVKPGFYADVDTKCQVIRRCDVNGMASAYLCPNLTIFNQITLVCHWFWDVDCSKAQQFYDYSNSRLYQADAKLLDDENDYAVAEALGAGKPAETDGKSAAKSAESSGVGDKESGGVHVGGSVSLSLSSAEDAGGSSDAASE